MLLWVAVLMPWLEIRFFGQVTVGAGFAVAVVAGLLLFLGGLLALIGGATMPPAARRHPVQVQPWPGYPTQPAGHPPG